MEQPNLFKALEEEWQATSRGPEAMAACAAWARSCPDLVGLASPAEVVVRCQQRGDQAGSAALLRAVLSQVGCGPWPTRTVLQAVLPGISSVSRRARALIGPHAPWQRPDELDQEAVTIAYERIGALAADPPEWPAMTIVDGTWQRLRRAAGTERRRSARRGRLGQEAPWARSVPSTTTAGEELADLLVDAVDLGILELVDARLVYASRIEDMPVEDLAARIGRNAWWAWRHRHHAEQKLAGAQPALTALAG